MNDVFHSDGRESVSVRERNRMESGNAIVWDVWWKNIGGRPSGPAAELVSSFWRSLVTI